VDKREIERQRAICNAATKAPWENHEPYSPMVTAQNPYGHGEMRVADIRGWGHLTGKGGCALTEEKAYAIQCANSTFIVNARTYWPAALDALEAAQKENEHLKANLAHAEQARDTATESLAQAQAEIATLKRERDAAVRDVKLHPCTSCVYNNKPECNPYSIATGDCHEWRGPCDENAPDGAESEGTK